MKVTMESQYSYDIETEKYDYHIGYENGNWILDVFNSSIENNNEAFIESQVFDLMEDCFGYIAELENLW